MGQMQVNTKSGPILVNIAGDLPTEEEKKYIVSNIDKLIENNPVANIAPEKEDISNYYRRLFAAQKGETFEPLSTDAVETPEIPKVEIDLSGVKNFGLRSDLAQAENDTEYGLRLKRAGFTENNFFKDPDAGYVLKLDTVSDDVKKRYNLPKSGNLAIEDEEKFTKQDFVEFFSSARGPIVGGVAASMAASGFGLPVAALMAGGGSALGYLIDEGIEYADKVQAQDSRSVTNTALFEFLAGTIGEGAGRAITAAFGRILKGPGGPEANEARALVRDLVVKEGARPTVKGANMSPIIGRMQAIYEGVFPNRGVARQNAKVIGDLIRNVDTKGKVDIDEIISGLQKDINRIYGTPDDLVREANKNAEQVLQKEIDKMIDIFGKSDKSGSRSVAKSIEIAKRTFDEDANSLYSKANELLQGKEVIPTQNLVSSFEKLVAKNRALELDQKSLGKLILGLKDKQFANVELMQSIRTAIRHADFDPNLIGSAEEGILGVIKKSVDDAFSEAEATASSIVASKSPKGADGKFISKKEFESLKDGFDYLRKAGNFYKSGISRFRQLHANKLFQQFKEGVNFDPEDLLKEQFGLIVPGNGETLKRFLNTVVPSGPRSVAGIRSGLEFDVPKSLEDVVPNTSVSLPDGSTQNMKQLVSSLPEDDPLRKHYQEMFLSRQRFADIIQKTRESVPGVNTREVVRKSMASQFLTKAISENTDLLGNINTIKVGEIIKSLGTTGKVLFKGEYGKVFKTLQDMQSSGKPLSASEIEQIKGRPITEQIEILNTRVQQSKDLKGLSLFRAAERAIKEQDPDLLVRTVFKKNGANAVSRVKNLVGENTATMENIKDLSMQKILAPLGRPDMNSAEFVEAVFSGKNAKALETSLNSYGRDTLEEMFGKETTDQLYKLVQVSRAISQEPIKGLGGLAPAGIVSSLGAVSFYFAPITTLTTLGGLKLASSMLRSKPLLKLFTKPTGVRPGQGDYDQTGRAIEIINELIGQVQAGMATTEEQPRESSFARQAKEIVAEATDPLTKTIGPMIRSIPPIINQARQQLPNVLPPSPASNASRVNPITVPDPLTRATFGQP